MAKAITDILSEYANVIVSKMASSLDAAMLARAAEVGGITRPIASRLRQSIGLEIRDNEIVITLPYYAIFINEGVKGSESSYDSARSSKFKFSNKMPPPSVFAGQRGWLSQKGMIDKRTLREKLKEKGLKGKALTNKLKKQTIKLNQSLAFAIARSIKEKGIPGYHFIDAALSDEVIDAMANALIENVEEDVVVSINLIKEK